MSAYTAAKVAAALSKDNNWATILIVVLIAVLIPLLVFMMLPMVLFSNSIDTPEIHVTLSDYLEISNDLDISYAHLISFDTHHIFV